MTSDEEPAEESSLEEQHVREDAQAFAVFTTFALFPVLIFGGLLAAILQLPAWTFLVVTLPVYLAHRLFPLWRLDRSSVPLKIAGVPTRGLERRKWLVIAAVVTVAELLLFLLRPYIGQSIADW